MPKEHVVGSGICVASPRPRLESGPGLETTCMRVAAAEVLEAATLYTEDLNHGQRYGKVRAVNPFIGT